MVSYALPVILHVAAGGVGIISGLAALAVRKGDRLHRLAGTVFFVSMLTMAGSAAIMAALAGQKANVIAGLFTVYLVATAWMTVRRPAGAVGRFEPLAMLLALGLAASGFGIGLAIVSTPGGLPDGDPSSGLSAPLYFVSGTLALLSAGLDGSVLKRGGLAGPDRLARHLWRMCLALFVAAGSFFYGQADEIPDSIEGPHFTVIPLIPLVAMAVWLVRVRVGRGRRAPGSMPARSAAQ